MLLLLRPKNGSYVGLASEYQTDFCTEGAKRLRADMDAEQLKFIWNDVAPGQDRDEHSHPAPVCFEWRDRPCEIGHNNRKIYTFLVISENADMSSPEVYITAGSSMKVYNLKIATRYYWFVQKNGRRSEVYSFVTEDIAPRFLRIVGVSNVRDMGGYKLIGGGVIRQGLMYRGSEFENKVHISKEGAEALAALKIKTDLDLRGEAKISVEHPTSELLGMNRISRVSEAYAGLFDEGEREELYTFFSTFASPENYPIYYHCRGGADRTGSYAFILGALYGMTLEDLILEYEITSISIWGGRNRNHHLFREFLDRFNRLSGEALSDKARAFLLEYAGLSTAQIDKIYEIAVCKDGK